MSQNSLVLATSGTLSGLAAVEAVNAALDTLNTLASGASAPSSPEAGQFWHDTGANLLKIRSADNTAWIIVGSLDETNHVFSAATKASPTIYGLALSNDSTTPATIIDVASGGAYDSTAAFYMRLASSIKKNVTAAWASGTGNGSLDTGSLQASKFYHVHLIYNATSGAVDVLTSLSYTSPTLPSGYGYFVAIGAIYINASSNVWAFTQTGNKFIPAAAINDLPTIVGSSTTAAFYTAAVPPGVKVEALIRVSLICGTTTGVPQLSGLFSSPDESDQMPSNGDGLANVGISSYSSQPGTTSWQLALLTNTAAQLRYRFSQSYGGVDITSWTYGFNYPRGLQ